ncbi:MAG: hypothetical protein KDJ29_05040 [Hyphomicrobiales bacterium]|nr:hypothetical protein [Acidimicrobiales bacterium]MCC2096231.1 hypothetical protein [Hyphomicrobiales bacterium]
MVGKAFKIEGTKFQWDRNWTHYRVAAVLGEDVGPDGWPDIPNDIVADYKKNLKRGWTGIIFEMKTPVAVMPDVKGIIDTGNIRIYPPFALNRKGSVSHVFDEVELPVGEYESDSKIAIPSHATKGAISEPQMDDAENCYGLRIDCAEGTNPDEAIEFLLRVIRQYTKQWWVGTTHNPFDTGVRLQFQLEGDYSPRELLRYKGAKELESPWYGAASTQGLIGFEEPLSVTSWKNVEGCFHVGYGVEDAMQYFFSAVIAFMSYDDRQTILNLALMFEVAENKTRILKNMNAVSKNKDLLKSPNIADDDDIETFRKLITDRDNLAHGRRPYHFAKNPPLMIEYLEKSAEFISRYLNSCQILGWDKALKTSL